MGLQAASNTNINSDYNNNSSKKDANQKYYTISGSSKFDSKHYHSINAGNFNLIAISVTLDDLINTRGSSKK